MNDFKLNPRLVEVRAAIILNNLAKSGNREDSKTFLWILKILIETAYPNSGDKFTELLKDSINDVLIGASKREIYTTLAVYYDQKKTWADKMGLNYGTFYNTISREYDSKNIQEEYLDSLIPRYTHNKDYYNICWSIASFIDNFKFQNDNKIENIHPRTLELKFWVIYNKIYNILQNQEKMISFLTKICQKFEMDYSSISGLSINISYISRSMPFSVPSKHQFYKEMINMGYIYGMEKGFISENLLGRRRSLLYLNYYSDISENILNDDYAMGITYESTLNWKYINEEEIIKFINLFIKLMERRF